MTTLRGYAICTTPRSGSNYLCQLLASTGVLGNPLEFFNPNGRRALESPDYPDDPVRQVERILSQGATANGVYGLKMFPDQFAAALQSVDLIACLPGLKFIRLLRRDLLGQAISWVRALQTHQYRSTQIRNGVLRYDGEAIAIQLGEIARLNASWDLYFARTGSPVLSLWYEDIEADRMSAITQASAFLGVDASRGDVSKINLEKQRDDLTEVWRDHFIREFGRKNLIELSTGNVETSAVRKVA